MLIKMIDGGIANYECWFENGRSNDLRRLLCKAINNDLSKVEENDLSVR